LRSRRRRLAGVDVSFAGSALVHLPTDLDRVKVVLIAAFLIAGVAMGRRSRSRFGATAVDFATLPSAPFAIGWFRECIPSGWNAATYIIGEMRDAARKPAAGHADGTLIVLVRMWR